MLTYDEAFQATVGYFSGDELAANVWISKYALRDAHGKLVEKTPVDMHRRLAKEFARIEAKYPNALGEDEIYSLLSEWTVVPQGSPMSAIGNPEQIQSLSNCFVLQNPADSYGGILHSDQQLVQIMKRRGGVGLDISSIRPRGLKTSNAAGTTDGIGVFMERFSNSTREVAQGGRRGALMISCHCLHPDIETFIAIKQDKTKVTGANVSIRVTDEFMRAVESDSQIILRWPVDSSVENAKFTKSVKAKELWDKFIDANWSSAEPGVLFWDSILDNSMADLFADQGFHTVGVNPCSELSLSALDSCRLLLVNYTKFVDSPFTSKSKINVDRLYDTCRKAQRLMDDLVDLEIEAIDRILAKISTDPEPAHIRLVEVELWQKVKEMAIKGRRTGLGETGLGDTLAMLGIKYGSEDSVTMTEALHKAHALAAHEESVRMAVERGAFPACQPTRYDGPHPMVEKLYNNSSPEVNDLFHEHGRRNIALTTIPPAGSVSILTQTSSGCEPVFMLSYTRRKKVNPNDSSARVDFIDQSGDKWTEYTVYHHGLKKWMEVTGETDITKSPYYGATASEIDWEKSVEIQAAAQKWIEHSISKTCNLPSTVTKEEVSKLYFKAWKSGCKGFTIYRDGCRSGVLVASSEKKEPKSSITETRAPKRPETLPCDIHRTMIGGKQCIMLVGLMDGKPYEIFCGLSDNMSLPKKRVSGKIMKDSSKDIATYDLVIPVADDEIVMHDIVKLFDNPEYESFTRTISLSLRHGAPVQFLCEQLRKDKHSNITSFSSAVARVLSKHYIADGTKPVNGKNCKKCNTDNLRYEGGCVICANCGESKCS